MRGPAALRRRARPHDVARRRTPNEQPGASLSSDAETRRARETLLREVVPAPTSTSAIASKRRISHGRGAVAVIELDRDCLTHRASCCWPRKTRAAPPTGVLGTASTSARVNTARAFRCTREKRAWRSGRSSRRGERRYARSAAGGTSAGVPVARSVRRPSRARSRSCKTARWRGRRTAKLRRARRGCRPCVEHCDGVHRDLAHGVTAPRIST